MISFSCGVNFAKMSISSFMKRITMPIIDEIDILNNADSINLVKRKKIVYFA